MADEYHPVCHPPLFCRIAEFLAIGSIANKDESNFAVIVCFAENRDGLNKVGLALFPRQPSNVEQYLSACRDSESFPQLTDLYFRCRQKCANGIVEDRNPRCGHPNLWEFRANGPPPVT